MAESQTLVILRDKRDKIERAIAAYEKEIQQARRDLAHVNATIRMFEAPEGRTQFPVYVDTLRLFKRGELAELCKAALADEGPLTTPELALRVARAKGLDEDDKVLRQSIAYRIVQALRLQWKRGKIESPEKRGGVRVWAIKRP
ncbi:MAG: hypothetical protein A49_31100 [Methyloceanibacter sp.]|nr:MAG: hypothetical protein A49_31100 [Methyloceanibacter sp.]